MVEPVRVLHVDDEPDFAELAATYLEREDERLTIETATDVAEGLEKLAEGQFDAIVSDFDMPGQDGLEFLEAVRADHPDLPFLLFTGKGSEEVASEAISAGVTDYLQKEAGTSQYTVLANRIGNAVEQYQSERGLEASQQRLSLFIEQSSLGVIEWDEDFDVVRMNQAAEDILGYTEEELRGKSWEPIVSAEDREAVADVVSGLLENQGGYHSVNENVRKDGQRIVCEWHNRVVTNDDGEVVAIFSQFQDITERYEREQAVEELHTTSRTLMEAESDEAVAEVVVGSARDILGLPATAVHLYDAAAEVLRPVAWTERSEELIGEVPDIAAGEGLAWEVFESGDSQIYTDVSSHPDRLNPDTAVRSEMLLPLGEHGVVLIGSSDPDDFDDVDVSLAQTLAAHATTALDRIDREQALARQQSLLDAQQEAVLDGMLVIDENRQIISYNDRFVELWDIPDGVVEGGEDEAALEVATNRLTDPEEFMAKVEYLYDHPDETARDEIELADGRVFDRYTTPLIGEDGTHFGRLWTFRDITERKEHVQDLKRERNRFEAVFETIPEPSVHVVFEGSEPIIRRVNAAFEEVFGYGSDEARGESVDDLIVPPDKQADAADINQSVRGSGIFQAEVRRETTTGERPFLFTAKTMQLGESDDEQLEGVATYVDLSELKQREAELARQNKRLDEFASVVSHDLRNPLNVASGRLELARDDRDSDHLEKAQRALDRMASLIEDVLMLAREGDRVGEFERTDLSEIVENCWENVETDGAELVCETQQAIQADRSRLQQLFENLFRNAVEHSEGAVTVTVGDLEAGFFVEDDGPGIPTEHRETVFEAGYSTTESGTGFGLAIVRQIADAHDWRVDLTDGRSGGARFEFTGVEIDGN